MNSSLVVSQKIGTPPASVTIEAVEIQVWAGTITSEFGGIPRAATDEA